MKIDKYIVSVLVLFGSVSLFQYFLFSAANNTQLDYDSYNKQEDAYDLVNTEPFGQDPLVDSYTQEKPALNPNAPAAPDNFEWVACNNMQAQFLKPEGWYFLEESNEQSSACFITQEEITDDSPFYETGFSVNAIQNASEQLPLPPKEFITSLLDEISPAFDEVEPYQILQSSASPLYGEATTMISEETTIYYLNYWNQDSDTMYLISFESPTEIWDKAWVTGETILTTLGFNPTY